MNVGGGGRTATTCAGKLVQLVLRSARPVQLFNATTYYVAEGVMVVTVHSLKTKCVFIEV